MRKKIFSCAFLFFLFGSASPQNTPPTHPLDPLTATEMRNVVEILKSSGTISGKDLFNIINLKEPPKKEVLAYKPGQSFRREAFTSFYDYTKNGVTEAIVDLNAGEVISVKNLPKVIGMGLEAASVAAAFVSKDACWVAALKKRGISIDSVTHRSIFTGDMGIAPAGHREQLVIARRKGSNVDIEGLIAYTDFTTGKILKIVDDPGAFSEFGDASYFNKDSMPETRKGPKPVVITQPEGRPFENNGHAINGQNWKIPQVI